MGVKERRQKADKRNKAVKAEKALQKEFDFVIDQFTENLFQFDWDEPELKDFDIFKEYDSTWREACKKWNSQKNVYVEADPELFTKLMINNNPVKQTNANEQTS